MQYEIIFSQSTQILSESKNKIVKCDILEEFCVFSTEKLNFQVNIFKIAITFFLSYIEF